MTVVDPALAVALAKMYRFNGPSFICPDCHGFSAHPDDAANSYCARCHAFKYESWQRPRCMEPTCENFGDYEFGGATCPEEHECPPAKRP